MPASEFDLIRRYFTRPAPARDDVVLGVGDDCALLAPPPGQGLAVSMDLLVGGVHFLFDTEPETLGHKALAVNLSDLAAMGAEPAWATLGLALPEVDDAWLEAFCRGFFGLAQAHGVALVGGDTTRGPLAVAVQVHGFVPLEMALRRDGARPGDQVFVTGTPGDAALALAALQGRVQLPEADMAASRQRLERPLPRLRQGLELRGLATAAIDVSDGLAQDLGHILERSGTGARLAVDALPLSPALAALEREQALALALGGGDDYELCFTAPPDRVAELMSLAAAWDCPCTGIGEIVAAPGLDCRRDDGRPYRAGRLGYDHFA